MEKSMTLNIKQRKGSDCSGNGIIKPDVVLYEEGLNDRISNECACHFQSASSYYKERLHPWLFILQQS